MLEMEVNRSREIIIMIIIIKMDRYDDVHV